MINFKLRYMKGKIGFRQKKDSLASVYSWQRDSLDCSGISDERT